MAGTVEIPAGFVTAEIEVTKYGASISGRPVDTPSDEPVPAALLELLRDSCPEGRSRWRMIGMNMGDDVPAGSPPPMGQVSAWFDYLGPVALDAP